MVPVHETRVIGVNGARVRRFVERLRAIEVLTEVYWSDCGDDVDVVLATYSLIVKAICNTKKHECRITIYYYGGERYIEPAEYSVGYVAKTIFSEAALAHGIAWYVVDRGKVKTCPYCRAIYAYPQEKFIDDVDVECQNCGKVFDTRQVPVESPPTRALDEPTECPYCRAQYVYRENDLDEQRTTACHNCGVRIAFPSILDEWQEYEQIQDDM